MAPNDLKSVIKQVYNVYQDQDFKYGEQGSDNLNPKREMAFEQLDKLEAKIQELTNAIVRRQLQPKKTTQLRDTYSLGEAPHPNQALYEASIRAGGDGTSILGALDGIEQAILLLPDQIPNPDCAPILEKYEFKDAETDEDPSDEYGYTNADLQGLGEEPDEESANIKNNGNGDEEDDEDCREVHMNFLKILIVIVKVIKILRKIIEFTLMPIDPSIQIAAWAANAWSCPPDILNIVQLILDIVISIVTMIVGMLIQLLWNLLNMDCRSEETLELIDQLRQCLSEFSSIANAFNVDSINFYFSEIENLFADPMNEILDQMQSNKEKWAQWKKDLAEDFSGQWTDFDKQLEAAVKQGYEDAINNDPDNAHAVSTVKGIIEDAKHLVNTDMSLAIKAGKDAWNSWKNPQKTITESPAFQSLEEASIMMSEKWEGLTIKKKEK